MHENASPEVQHSRKSAGIWPENLVPKTAPSVYGKLAQLLGGEKGTLPYKSHKEGHYDLGTEWVSEIP